MQKDKKWLFIGLVGEHIIVFPKKFNLSPFSIYCTVHCIAQYRTVHSLQINSQCIVHSFVHRTSWRTFYRFAEDSKRIALLPPSRSDLCKEGDWIKPLGVLRRRAKLLNFNLVLFFSRKRTKFQELKINASSKSFQSFYIFFYMFFKFDIFKFFLRII